MSCSGGSGPADLELVAGDLLPPWVADAEDCEGPIDWTGWDLEWEMRGPVVVTGTVTGDALGVLTHTWVDGETDVPGEYTVLIRGVSPAPESLSRTFLVPGIVRILQSPG